MGNNDRFYRGCPIFCKQGSGERMKALRQFADFINDPRPYPRGLEEDLPFVANPARSFERLSRFANIPARAR
jgi:hypothetical protein